MSILLSLLAALGNSDTTPNAVNWGNIGPVATSGTNANQTITGCDRSITLSASGVGVGVTLQYSLAGGAFATYSAPFSVDAAAGQTLRWQVAAILPGTQTGTITVTNDSDGGATLDTFTYSVTGS